MSLTLFRPGEATVRPVKLLVVIFNPSPREIVSVTCSFNPKLTSMTTVDTLILYGSKPDSNDWQILASIDRKEPNPRFLGSRIAKSFKLTGFFGFDDNKSELDLSWTMLPQDFISRYLCTAEGADSDGRKVTSADVVEVSRPEPQVDKSTCDDENLYDVEEIVEDLTEASIGTGESLDERLKNLENSLPMSIDNVSNKCLKNLQDTKKKINEHTTSGFQSIEASTSNNMKNITSTLNDLHESLVINLEATTESLKNLQATMDHTVKTNQNRFQELETTSAENMKTVTNFFQNIQDTMGTLAKAIATQASAIKILEARFMFDVSSEFCGKRYLVSKSADFNIHTADAACVVYGGYLAEPDDQPEFDFIVKFLKVLGTSVHYAVGVNDIEVERKYVFYHTKRAVTYSRWRPGEPNNRKGREECTLISEAGYIDIPCSFGAKYICEVQF